VLSFSVRLENTYINMTEKIDKLPTATTSSPDISGGESGLESTLPQHGKVHYVDRGQNGVLATYEAEHIPGYDADLMSARATLSSTEEKKLLRRIDWHLIPLLAVMYMLKSIDFTNVGSYLDRNPTIEANMGGPGVLC
jgi:hypothetical protein